jgi:hypothetical protein
MHASHSIRRASEWHASTTTAYHIRSSCKRYLCHWHLIVLARCTSCSVKAGLEHTSSASHVAHGVTQQRYFVVRVTAVSAPTTLREHHFYMFWHDSKSGIVDTCDCGTCAGRRLGALRAAGRGVTRPAARDHRPAHGGECAGRGGICRAGRRVLPRGHRTQSRAVQLHGSQGRWRVAAAGPREGHRPGRQSSGVLWCGARLLRHWMLHRPRAWHAHAIVQSAWGLPGFCECLWCATMQAPYISCLVLLLATTTALCSCHDQGSVQLRGLRISLTVAARALWHFAPVHTARPVAGTAPARKFAARVSGLFVACCVYVSARHVHPVCRLGR